MFVFQLLGSLVLVFISCSAAARVSNRKRSAGITKCSWRVEQTTSTVNESPVERFELYSCPQEGRPLLTACCPAPNEYSKCCLPQNSRGDWTQYLWQNHSWLFYWAFAGLGLASISATCVYFHDIGWSCQKRVRKSATWFVGTCGVVLPCFGIPAFFLWLLFFRKTRCKLCGEDVKIRANTYQSHKLVCKEYRMEEYQRIPDSTNYFCKKCDDAPLKIWPPEKLAKTKCSKCRERIINFEGNLHLCFICDKALCPRHLHPSDPSAAVIVDWDFMEGIPDATMEGIPDATETDPSASALLVQPSSSHDLPSYSPQSTDFHPSAPVPLRTMIHSEIGGQGSTPSYIPRDSVQHPPSGPYLDLPPSYDIAVQDKS